jgi:hypothetical protein
MTNLAKFHKPSTADLKASQHVRERIEKVQDEKLRYKLHIQYCDFTRDLNEALSA